MSADIRGLAVQAIALRVLEDRVGLQRARINNELAEALDVGDRKIAALDSGVPVGSVSFAKGRRTAFLADERALLAWAREEHPDEIVESVRPSFVRALLNDVKHTGEAVPGIEIRDTAPYLSVRPDPAAVPDLVDAIRAGQLLALDTAVTPEGEAAE